MSQAFIILNINKYRLYYKNKRIAIWQGITGFQFFQAYGYSQTKAFEHSVKSVQSACRLEPDSVLLKQELNTSKYFPLLPATKRTINMNDEQTKELIKWFTESAPPKTQKDWKTRRETMAHNRSNQ